LKNIDLRDRGTLTSVALGVPVRLAILVLLWGFNATDRHTAIPEPNISPAVAVDVKGNRLFLAGEDGGTLEVFDRHNSRHWAVLMLGFAFSMGLGLVWMGIRGDYRSDYVELDKFASSRSARIERVRNLTGTFLSSGDILNTTDALVDRMWTIYYPALAVERVPSVLPHTDGAIFGAAVTHILTPRIFFPNKGELMSDSDMVRKYSNIQVAGREHGTSIAFGYAAESYIDFGIPLMFLPVFGFGVFLGFCYVFFRPLIWHRELFVAFGTVAFWLSAYLFERDWANMLGISVSLMVYLGAPVVLLDRFLMVKVAHDQDKEEQAVRFDSPIQQDRF